MDRGTTDNPSAAPSTALEMYIENEQDDRATMLPCNQPPVGVGRQVGHSDMIFIEFFAGSAGLSAAVAAKGLRCGEPQDVDYGGADFSELNDVQAVKAWLHELRANGLSLLLHFAPPCSTFSRARDRSWRTRLRSSARPQGLFGKGAACKKANLIARNTLDLIEWAVDELYAKVTLENPETSYLWSYLDFREDLWYEDVVFSPCMFGGETFKPTKVRSWGWRPSRLDRKCKLVGGTFTCGRTKAEPHVTLEFGGARTNEAAAYIEEVCTAWAEDLYDLASEMVTDEKAVDMADLRGEGRVYRHVLRGLDAMGSKEFRELEDQKSTAGMRNPWHLKDVWPELFTGLASLRSLFLTFRGLFSNFQGLTDCCGAEPLRLPPGDEELGALRRCMAILFEVDPEKFVEKELASPWLAGVVEALVKATGDSDVELVNWLRVGAPMGLTRPIRPGGHFPQVEETPDLTVDDLDKYEPKAENHPSFTKARGDEGLPGLKLLSEQIEAGYCYLFESMEHACEMLGGKVHPAPLGNVEKLKEDGTWKDRVIQDQTANMVNLAVFLPERQVLPRGIDHGRDLAVMQADLQPGEVLQTLVLDFKDAFMSLAIHPSERRFNCAHTTVEVERQRPALFEGEVVKGKFVVWRVLGFGGRPNPLVFSRAASLACRAAQGLIGVDRVDGVAEVRCQLYVDDPVVTVRGTPEACRTSLDLVIMLWLSMGIPLAWKKGQLYGKDEPHRWIGIMYSVTDEGAVMRLPEEFIEDLRSLLKPACSPKGMMTINELEVLVGKAARVAHVVPAAKPFVGGLWGAMAAARRPSTRARKVPTRRFCYSAAWLLALLAEDGSCPLVLERLVTPWAPRPARTSGDRIEFDASVYGGGALLRDGSGCIVEYFSILWTEWDAPHLGVAPGDPKHQTFFEFLTLLLALMVWGNSFVETSVAVLGDNVGSLSAALSLKGRGNLLAVARELSWRRARHRWSFEVAHLPSEHNVVADSLSRVADPKGVPWPSVALGGALAVRCPKVAEIWKALPK